MSLFLELKRRNVFRVAVAYLVASWLLVQVGDIARESFEAPAWVMKMLITTLVAGFPFVVFFSWAFEMTPEGIKREKEVDRSRSITNETAQKLNYVTITLLVLAIAVVGIDRYLPQARAPAGPTATENQTASEASPEPPPAPAGDRNSIAVLPFVNMSNDPDQDYFSDGISEELLNLLVGVDGLKVASRTSSFAFKGSSAGIPNIARELKVTNVLEGSVRKSGNRIRITAQLIDAANDRHLWSESYDRELDDIFAIQDEIASAIVAALESELGLDLDEEEVTVAADTGNMTAYDLFLRGRGMVIDRRKLQNAAALLEQAVALDPGFARAWAMLGTAYYLVPSWTPMGTEEQAAFNAEAERAVGRALELDPNQSQAWAIRAMLLQHAEGGPRWEEIVALLDRAIDLDPSNASAWLWQGLRLTEMGYHEQARARLERCLEVDPAYRNCRRHLSRVSWILGDREAAIDHYIEIARGGFTPNDALFAPLFFHNGNVLASVISANYLRSRYPDFPMDAWLDALEYPGRDHTPALAGVLEWIESTPDRPIGSAESLLLALGAYDHLRLDMSYVNNWIWLPDYPEFRRSPHFHRLMREMNLPAYWDAHGPPPGCEKVGEDYRCD